jgi:hypothetical protein
VANAETRSVWIPRALARAHRHRSVAAVQRFRSIDFPHWLSESNKI